MSLLAALPYDQPWFPWAVLGTVVSGFSRGLTGFGGAMLLSPLFGMLMGPAFAVPFTSAIDTPSSAPMLIDAWRRCRWREVLLMAFFAALLVPVGTWLLIAVDGDILRRATGIMVLIVVAVMAAGWRYRGAARPWITALVGMLSGASAGATGMAGPPVILFWLGSRSDVTTMRANIIMFFGIIAAVMMASFAISGLYTRPVLIMALALGPLYACAVWLGSRSLKYVSESAFRWFAYAVIAFTAALSVFR